MSNRAVDVLLEDMLSSINHWQIVTRDLPKLKPDIESLLDQFDETKSEDSATPRSGK